MTTRNLGRRRTENPAQWKEPGDRRLESERILDAYLATQPGSAEARETLDAYWLAVGVHR